MTSTDIIALGALSVAIIAIFIQISMTKKQLVVQNFSSYTQRYNAIIGALPFSVIEKKFNFDNFKIQEKEALLRIFLQYYDLCYEEFYLYKNGYISKRLWNEWKLGIQSALRRESFRQAWKIIKENSSYGYEFEKLINTLIMEDSIRSNL